MTASPASATWRVEVGADAVTAVYEAAGDARAVFVFAHGAGGRMDDAGMLKLAAAFRARGLSTVRFNFVYREKGSGRPDPMPRLMECVSAVVARVRDELRPPALVIGGRSMGGRAASMLAADGFACDGLLLLAYPLHPDKQPEKLRDAHLPSIQAPVLCFNGTRDALCRRDLMEATLQRVGPRWTMHWLEGADHSFHVLKSSGRTDEQVVDEVASTTRGWLAGLG
jgi:predicted alpha/beta-hydrolase family hydrolase